MNRIFSLLFLAGGLLASGMPCPAAASTPPQRKDGPSAHADDKGGLPEDSTSSSQKGAKDADKATSISQQRKQSVEAIEKLLEKRLFKNAAKQALKQLDV